MRIQGIDINDYNHYIMCAFSLMIIYIHRRPRCYLAPERFYTAKNDGSNAKLMPASDIFSLGCVIAEIFMDGQVLFDYGQLLKYKAHGFDEYDPTKLLAKKINDKNVRELIEHCINLEPKSRWTPQKYLDFYKDKIFPKYFDDLYELFKKFLSVTFSESDHKIKYLQKKYIDILKMVSNGNQSFHIPQLFKKENKKQGQTQALTPKMQSNMSLLSPLSSPTNGPQQANIPKLEIIMRQQKRQQQQQAIDENIADDSYVFPSIHIYLYIYLYILYIDRTSQEMMNL